MFGKYKFSWEVGSMENLDFGSYLNIVSDNKLEKSEPSAFTSIELLNYLVRNKIIEIVVVALII